MPDKLPQGVSEWLTRLADKPLPVLDITRKNINKLVANPQLSITQYANPIVYDAGFAMMVFRHVNQQRDKAGRRPLSTLDNALSHFGQQAFKDFLKKTASFEELKLTEKNQQGYRRVMQQACHAALQARDWAQLRNVLQPEETQLAALLQGVTELMLWCYGDDTMPRIEHFAYVDKKPYAEAAKEVLGCSMNQLGHALAEAWKLPEMTLDGLSDKADDFTLATGVSLAYQLARCVELNWYGKTMQQLIERIAKYKGKKEGEIERLLHLNAVSASEEMLAHGFQSPSRLLPMLADDAFIYPEFRFTEKNDSPVEVQQDVQKVKSAAELRQSRGDKPFVKPVRAAPETTAKGVTPTKLDAAKRVEAIRAKRVAEKQAAEQSPAPSAVRPAEKTTTIRPELAAAIKQFNQLVAQAAPAHDLIEYAVKMSLLCGVERCKFFIKLPKKHVIVSRYFAQAEDVDAIPNFKVTIDRPSLFTLIMEKSRNLFLNESNRGKYWQSIPDQVKLALGVKRFFMMSIFVKNHAMGMMYADKVNGELTAAEFKQFVGICNLLSKGIIQSAHNKHKQSESIGA